MPNQIGGLTTQEAQKRLMKYGENLVYKKQKLKPIVFFLKKFTSPLLLMLIVAAVIAFFVGQQTNAIIVLAMVLVSGILDFVNSHKSQKAEDALFQRIITTATVYRNGQKVNLPLKEIVPGDIVYLVPGNVVPADAQVLAADDFFVNQSALTGESFPVEKHASPEIFSQTGALVEQRNRIFMGTNVVTGFATARVLKTGKATEFGVIAEKLKNTKSETEFDRGIKKFSLFIMKITFVLVALVFLVNALLNKGVLDSFIFAIAIAVGLTPELLPVILSVSLSRGSLAMAKKAVVVKNLPAIQNLGTMDVLCTDKTGTLTEDKIVLVKHLNSGGENSERVLVHAYLSSVFHTGVQNPLDSAIKNFRKLNIESYQKIDEIPFDFTRRRQSVVVESRGQRLMITKGAPEDMLKVTAFCRLGEKPVRLDQDLEQKIKEVFNGLSANGFRVLAVAVRELPLEQRVVYENTEEKNMVFEGFMCFLDPAKDSALEAINELEAKGVEVKILTGDNEILTQKICQEIDLPIKGVLIGSQIGHLTDEALKVKAAKTTIFARFSPSQKERIIQILRKSGRVVGYLGDGINDAPALIAADVGISVNNAVDVAKDAADIILLKKSLEVLRAGVIEGRRTFQNTLKYMMMSLSSNFGNMFSMMAASMLLPFLPMLPSQILLNNFIYDTSQVTLPSDQVDNSALNRPPRWRLNFIKRYMVVFGLVSSFFDFVTFAVLFLGFGLAHRHFQTGWFIESLTTQILVIFIIRTRKMPFVQSRPSRALFLSVIVGILVAWLIPFTPLARAFQFVVLPSRVLAVIFGIVIIYLVVVEITKRLFFKQYVDQHKNSD
ncbi:magnesium-translocating P-type ATPase [Candidatus Parcubacteria bacterium]|jgi:Mg2+-importing ATPase|nr:MAG: magnesium-translocating P-type ATPase [Candidatus Parcubacteria bacterium]